MKVIDTKLLAEFRDWPYCEWCRKTGTIDVHHIFSKGAGRLDIRQNLIALCRVCHSMNHAGKVPTKRDLLCFVAMREGTKPAKIEEKIHGRRRETICKVWKVS